MKQKIILLLILSVELFALFQWFSCSSLAGQFHYSAFDLQLRLIDSIHNDSGIPIWLVRLFHNKMSGLIFDVSNAYLQFWSLLFLASFVSLSGIMGLAAQFYYFFAKKKNLVIWAIFLYLLLAPLVEIFGSDKITFIPRIMILSLPYLLWSMLGYWNLLEEKKFSLKIIYGVIFVSLWYQLAQPTFNLFCVFK